MMGQVHLFSKVLFTLLKVISYTVQMAEIKIKTLKVDPKQMISYNSDPSS